MALAAFVETELNRASRDQSRSNEGIEAGVIAQTAATSASTASPNSVLAVA
jgi:hypothetical protein